MKQKIFISNSDSSHEPSTLLIRRNDGARELMREDSKIQGIVKTKQLCDYYRKSTTFVEFSCCWTWSFNILSRPNVIHLSDITMIPVKKFLWLSQLNHESHDAFFIHTIKKLVNECLFFVIDLMLSTWLTRLLVSRKKVDIFSISAFLSVAWNIVRYKSCFMVCLVYVYNTTEIRKGKGSE